MLSLPSPRAPVRPLLFWSKGVPSSEIKDFCSPRGGRAHLMGAAQPAPVRTIGNLFFPPCSVGRDFPRHEKTPRGLVPMCSPL